MTHSTPLSCTHFQNLTKLLKKGPRLRRRKRRAAIVASGAIRGRRDVPAVVRDPGQREPVAAAAVHRLYVAEAALRRLGRILGRAAVVGDEPVAQLPARRDGEHVVAQAVDAEVGDRRGSAFAAAECLGKAKDGCQRLSCIVATDADENSTRKQNKGKKRTYDIGPPAMTETARNTLLRLQARA